MTTKSLAKHATSKRVLSPATKGLVVGAIFLVSWIVFAAGLLAPLTPSDGRPSAQVLFTFAGVPLLLLLLASWRTHGGARTAAIVQTLALAGITAWLVLIVQR